MTRNRRATLFRTVASSLLRPAVFLRRFDPEAALSKRRREMGEASDTEAYLLATHKGAEKPAVVRLYKEDGAWKVGLAETFRGQPVRSLKTNRGCSSAFRNVQRRHRSLNPEFQGTTRFLGRSSQERPFT